MTLTHTLALALLALGLAAAHTIPDIAPELEKKLAEVVAEALKDEKPMENIVSEQELIDQANTVKDVENKLRTQPTEIPVKVVQEVVKLALKTAVGEEKTSEIQLKRAEPDLEHPGAPQYQEHDTQNAVHYEDSQALLTNIKKAIADSQAAFNQGYAAVSEHVRNFFVKDEQVAPIQESIRELQISFSTQIEKLNTFVRNAFTAQSEKGVSVPGKEIKLRSGFETIESQLKQVESTFQKGLNTISKGVEVFAEVKAETSGDTAVPAASPTLLPASDSAPASVPASVPAPAPAPAPATPSNPLADFISSVQTNIQNGLNTVQTTFVNYFGGGQQNQQSQPQAQPAAQPANQQPQSEGSTESTTTNNQGNPFQGPLQIFQSIFNPGTNNAAPAGAQSDDTNTQRPNIFQQGIQNLQNIFNPNQQTQQTQQVVQSDAQQPAANQPNRPFDLANIPVIGSVVQLWQPRPQVTPIKPADPVKKPDSSKPETPTGTNMVPEKIQADQASAASSPQPAKPTEPHRGPIQQISQQIQKNPIVKGIQGAVQRLQHTISRNPDEPRDAVTEKVVKPEETVAKSDIDAAKGHGSGGANTGDSNVGHSGVVVDNVQVKDAIKPNVEEKKEPQKIEEPEKIEKPQKMEEPPKVDNLEKPQKEEPQKSDMASNNLPSKTDTKERKMLKA